MDASHASFASTPVITIVPSRTASRRVLVRPSDRDVHDGVAGTVEQRHHAETDIACGDPAFEIVVQEVGRLRLGLILGPRDVPADRQRS